MEFEIPNVARRISDLVNRTTSLWTKWNSDQEELIHRLVEVWIPMGVLRDALNRLPGESLTPIDVEQWVHVIRDARGGYQQNPSPNFGGPAI